MDRSRSIAIGAIVVALLATLAVAGAAATPADRVLVVEDAATGERLIETPVENGTVVALEYTHSVEKTRVLDAFTVRGDRLVMTRMEFESYGWGLPANAEVTRENGTFSFDPDYASEELVVKPGRTAGHRLHVGSRTYDLVERSDARAVRISVERRSVLEAALDRSARYIGVGT
ncbi:MAG: DUF1850 domain-containing protein [Halalkalicoccus sp.]|nr:DUF1850 domain-containing protein [Halalkalicoccus sp.]